MESCWKCAAPLEAGVGVCDACGASQLAERKARLVIDFDDEPDEAPPPPVEEVTEIVPPPASHHVAAQEPGPAPDPKSEPTSEAPVAEREAAQPPAAPEREAEPWPEPPESSPEPAVAIMAAPTQAPTTQRAPLLVDPVELVAGPVHGSVRRAVDARKQLWAEVDGAQALLAVIETAANAAAHPGPRAVEAHPRLTSGTDLVGELRSIESAVRDEVQAMGQRESTIAAHEAEIARLKRNRMILIASSIAAAVLLLIIIASQI